MDVFLTGGDDKVLLLLGLNNSRKSGILGEG